VSLTGSFIPGMDETGLFVQPDWSQALFQSSSEWLASQVLNPIEIRLCQELAFPSSQDEFIRRFVFMVEDVMEQECWRNVYPIIVSEEVMAMPHDAQVPPTPLDDRANLPIWIPLVIP
jgi:hypothetical protein